MTKIYITQEEFNLDEEYILFENVQKVSKLYIGPSEYDDYDDETRQFLYDFICKQALFPVFLTFEPYNDLTEEIEFAFQKECIQYFLKFESTKKNSFPVFKVIINDAHTLKLILEETFWIASSNQFYSISFSDIISYKLEIKEGVFGGKKSYMFPCFNMKNTTTILKLWHDGQGCNLYTNDPRYSTIEMLTNHLPNETIMENKG
ncbi:hypothetical protein LCL96_21235 [Rossellomorea aquimaris]|uniref:hypothetical protein n=1 Tax=Rossellomorea aquimaris TaxID=189382 RepID=UPI001CD4E616|nr:hypothetical protein [Rossellomorea aquimaris]MCA1061444.1 hypothetical protein [Rossellomorea aquimaris]